jgi:O-antigen/teichoic acid export membrane protein
MMKDSYFRIAIGYGSGLFIAQLISFGTALIVSSLYSPAEYGFFATLISISVIILPLATLKVESLISVSESFFEIYSLTNFVKRYIFLISFSSSLISFVIFKMLISYDFLVSLITSLLIGVTILFQGFSVVLIQLNLKKRKFRAVNISGLIQNSMTAIIQVFFGLFKPVGSFLLLGYGLGRISSLLTLNPFLRPRQSYQKIPISESLTIFKKSRFFIGLSFLDALMIGAPMLLLNGFYGNKYAGYFALLQSFLAVPVNLISSTFAAIAFSHITEKSESPSEEEISHRIRLQTNFRKPLIVITIFYIAACLILGESIFSSFVNASWDPMYPVLPIMAISSGVGILWNPIMILLNLENKSHFVFQSNLGRFILGFFSSILGVLFHASWVTVINLFFVSQLIFQTVWIMYLMKKSNVLNPMEL